MFNCPYEVLESKNLIYDMSFEFWQKQCNAHGLIQLIDEIRAQLDKGNFGSRISADFQKLLDTIEYNILIQKLNCK